MKSNKLREAYDLANEECAEEAIYELRILLSDIVSVLSACGANGRNGRAIDHCGNHVSRRVLQAAHSLLHRGLRHIDFAGFEVSKRFSASRKQNKYADQPSQEKKIESLVRAVRRKK